MIPDLDDMVAGLSSSMSLKVLPLASRTDLPGRSKVAVGAQRLVADLEMQINMRKGHYQKWLHWHDVELKQGRAKFTSSKLKKLLGADALVMRFRDDPRIHVQDKQSGTLALSVRLMGRVTKAQEFDLGRHVLTKGLSVQRFSSSRTVELLGGDISKTGALFGEQYTVSAALKLYQDKLESLLAWYFIVLAGGAQSFEAEWLADIDSRLSNKKVMLAGGLDCTLERGIVRVNIKLWVVSDQVTQGILGE